MCDMKHRVMFKSRVRRLAASLGVAAALAFTSISCKEKPRRPAIAVKKPSPDRMKPKEEPNPLLKDRFESIKRDGSCPKSDAGKELKRSVDSWMKLNSVYFWIRDVPHKISAKYTVLVQVNKKGRVKDFALKVHGRYFNHHRTSITRYVGTNLFFTPGRYCHIKITGNLFSSRLP